MAILSVLANLGKPLGGYSLMIGLIRGCAAGQGMVFDLSVLNTGGPCLVPRPHYYARPMRFGSCGPRKFLRPRQTRRSETFCLTWGGAFGSGRAVNNFSALMKDVQQPWRVQRIKS